MQSQQTTDDRRLLIIEDDPIVANIYRRRFERDGYGVEICPDGRAGFFRLHEAAFSAVLLDLMLPQMNGLEILNKIRAQRQFGGLPVIVLTNTHLGQLAEKAAAAGASRVFYKSAVTPATVLDAVNACVSPGLGGSNGKAGVSGAASEGSERNGRRAPNGSDGSASMGSFSVSSSESRAGLQMASEASFSRRPVTGSSAFSDDEPSLADISSLEQAGAAMLDSAQQVKEMRYWLKDLQTAPNAEKRLDGLRQMVRSVHLTAAPEISEDIPILARVTEAFEALLWELTENPSVINASTLMTLSKTTDFIAELVTMRPEIPVNLKPSVMVVDDDLFSRRAVIKALEKVEIRPVVLENPLSALERLQAASYDLVITDVDMPEMTGFELCKKMRESSCNRSTPVIFVTVLDDFEHRVQSALSGGNELIAKPFVLIELAVKSLVHVLRRHTSPGGRQVVQAGLSRATASV